MMNKWLAKAQQQHQQGLLNEALETYLAILEDDADNADAQHGAGVVYAQLGNLTAALKHITLAITHDPDNALFYNSKGNVLSQLGDFIGAAQAYDIAIKLKPGYEIAYNNLANCFYRQKKIDLALNTYQKVINLHPDFANAYFNYGRLLAELEDYDAAIQVLTKAVTLDNQHALAHGQLAHIYLHQGDFEKAIFHYQQRLLIQPAHADSHHDLGLALLKAQQYEQAIEHFEQSLVLQTTQIECHYHLATAYLYSQNYPQALAHYLRQLENGPHLASYYNVGVLHMYHERHEAAIEYLQQAIALDPRYTDAHINLATVYLKLKKLDEAANHYELALMMRPNDPEIKHILAALQQGAIPDTAPKEYVSHLFDQYAPYYDQHLTVYLQYRAPQLMYQAIDTELNTKDNFGVILDLGCGTGLCGEWFKPKAEKLIGIDLSAQMLVIAGNKKIYDELKPLSVLEALVTYKNMNIILAADVFTYIGNLDEIFTKANAALVNEGLFAFTVEKSTKNPYELRQTIRYAHHEKYLRDLIEKNYFTILHFDNMVLRKQYQKDVDGYFVLLRKGVSISA